MKTSLKVLVCIVAVFLLASTILMGCTQKSGVKSDPGPNTYETPPSEEPPPNTMEPTPTGEEPGPNIVEPAPTGN